MASEQEHIQTALDTLMEICKMSPDEIGEQRLYEKRAAAEEILRHYREGEFMRDLKERGLTVNINGVIPVRPVTRAEASDAK